jgi:hypothetical protein
LPAIVRHGREVEDTGRAVCGAHWTAIGVDRRRQRVTPYRLLDRGVKSAFVAVRLAESDSKKAPQLAWCGKRAHFLGASHLALGRKGGGNYPTDINLMTAMNRYRMHRGLIQVGPLQCAWMLYDPLGGKSTPVKPVRWLRWWPLTSGPSLLSLG